MPDTIAPPAFTISASAMRRIAHLREKEGNPALLLRISVSGGGCSGFKYGFDFDSKVAGDDLVFEREGVTVVIDTVSMGLLGNAEVDFKEDLMGSYFAITNPNAKSSCGCGSSFSVD